MLLATPFLRDDFVLRQLVLDPLRIGVFTVDLVDCNDHRHARCLRVLNGLDGLRHHAVISRNHENDDIRRLRTARTHRRKRGMARRIKERDLAFVGVRRNTRRYAA